MISDYKILQSTLSIRKFLSMSNDLQRLHLNDINHCLEKSFSTIKNSSNTVSSSYGKILLSHLKSAYKTLKLRSQELENTSREEKIDHVSHKLGLGKRQISILLQMRSKDLNSQSQYIQCISETSENLLLLKHFFQQSPYPKIQLACLEKIKFWDLSMYQTLYEKLTHSKEPEIQAYLRLAS
ncbi:hypothetical protein MJH12_19845 [bacterium]|nr:hypothetical protein [bacterium]